MNNVVNTTNQHYRDITNIQALKQLKQGNNIETLKTYSGWGGLRKSIYNPEIYRQLKEVLTDTEIKSIKQSLKSAYYTPKPMIEIMYAILKNRGFSGGKILEPSAGHGAFIEFMPEDIKANSEIIAVEKETVSAQIISKLYPTIKVYNCGFEDLNFKPEFDLVIGNPPYSSTCLFDLNHKDLKDYAIHHYFTAKSFRLLKQGGILAMVLPSYCLDNKGSHVRTLIAREGGRLIEAYRLPDNLFSDAKVTIDLVFIIKDRTANQFKWDELQKITVGEDYHYINKYFAQNPQHVLGQFQSIQAYGRKLLTCKGDAQVYDKLKSMVNPIAKISHNQKQGYFTKIEFLLKEIDENVKQLLNEKENLLKAKQQLSSLFN